MPGFTSISMFPRVWQETGVDYPTLVDRLVADALRRGTGCAEAAQPGSAVVRRP